MFELFSHHKDVDFVNKLAGHFRSKSYDKALALADSLSEQTYSDANMHFLANQFAALIRKYPWNPKVVGTDPETKALESFRKSERRCRRMNRKFDLYDKIRSPHEGLLSRMSGYIQYVIGVAPVLEEVFDKAAFGAGASLGVHGNATNLLRKIGAEKWTVSPGAFVHSYVAIMRNPQLRHVLLEERGGITCYDWETSKARFSSKAAIAINNKISFVPKTAKTHRAIAVEPLLNGYLQKGIDEVLRKKLNRVGIDLRDQTRNQRMARLGSLDDTDNGFVTIDLSSASDSISIGLARRLLPPSWYELLNSTRSIHYCVGLDSALSRYEKFCSMGNGFCFPLETLIFAACIEACGGGKVGVDYSVYGDDIIVRKRHASEVLRALKVLGFTPNVSKTFVEGRFRESCGADYFSGVNVRPYTLDYALDSLEALFKWLNLTQSLNEKTRLFFEGSRHIILDAIPHRLRFYRPFKGNVDSGIDATEMEHLTSPHCRFDRRQHMWIVKELLHTPVRDNGRGMEVDQCKTYIDLYSLLSGARSEQYEVCYTFRRKTRTSVTFTGCSGATAMWLPSMQA
jgi:hypothetical protein